jgi:hypothetical protein
VILSFRCRRACTPSELGQQAVTYSTSYL